jgi:hypothetical protein
MAAIPNSKKLRGVGCRSGKRAMEHEINQGLPTVKEQIFGQSEDILKKPFTSPTLLTDLLVIRICQMRSQCGTEMPID